MLNQRLSKPGQKGHYRYKKRNFQNNQKSASQLFSSNDRTTKIEAIIEIANKFNLSDTIKHITDLLDNHPNGQ